METAIGIIFAVGVLAFMAWAVVQAYKRAKAKRESSVSGNWSGGASPTSSGNDDREARRVR